VNTSPVSCHLSPAAVRSGAWASARPRSAATASRGRARVRRDRSVLVSPRADRSPYRDAGREWGSGAGVAGQVDVVPAQRPGFLGADAR
jgi:hypothetical protein